MRGEGKYASSVDKPVYARDAWKQGRRFGVIASSDDHMGQPGKPTKGLAAVYAPRNTREDIWTALKARACYGTTGERILLDFRIDGRPMGSEFSVPRGTKLRMELNVHGADELASVEVMRLVFDRGLWERAFFERFEDRDAFREREVKPLLDFSTSFLEPLSADAVYYARATQRTMIDGCPAFAWSSPIWVTCRE